MKNQLNLNNLIDLSIDSLNIKNTTVLNIFRDSNILAIKNLNIEKSKLDSNSDEINIHDIQIEHCELVNLEICKNLNLISVTIQEFTIKNLNMEQRLKIKHSQIESINLDASTFEDLQIIDNTNSMFEYSLDLKNTTIKNAVLDKLKYKNFDMSDAHVSEAKIGYVKFKNGSRETNRFFKNYYDSISDYIQANEYYKQEMQEQYKITEDEGEKFLLGFNKVVSDFGQSWLRPLGYIFLTTLLFLVMIHKDKITFDAKFVVYFVSNFHDIWNSFWKFINPFSKTALSTYENVYGWWMIHKLLMTIFIYHFIVAIKRKTKR